MTKVPKELWQRWWRDNLTFVSAGVSFYLLVAFAPLLAFLAGILGIVITQQNIQVTLVEQVSVLTNPVIAETANFLLSNVRGFTNNDLITSLISFLALLWAAAGLFVQLQTAFNSVFGVVQSERSSLWLIVQRYVLAVVFVFSLGALVLLYILSVPVLGAIELLAGTLFNFELFSTLWGVIKISGTVVVLAVLLASLYKILPATKVKTMAALAGGTLAAIGYTIGAQLLTFYFSTGLVNSAYGVASSVVVVLLWVYFAAQILILGALLTSQLNSSHHPTN